jgi:hypothetical protein
VAGRCPPVGKLAADYLPAEDRPAEIAVGAGAGFAGMLIALLLGPTLGGGGHIERLLIVEAILAHAAAAILAWELRVPAPNEGWDEERAAVDGRAVRALWVKPQMRNMAGLVFVGFGVFVALTTWLQTLLEPARVSEGAAGALLVGMLVFGMVGCAILRHWSTAAAPSAPSCEPPPSPRCRPDPPRPRHPDRRPRRRPRRDGHGRPVPPGALAGRALRPTAGPSGNHGSELVWFEILVIQGKGTAQGPEMRGAGRRRGRPAPATGPP